MKQKLVAMLLVAVMVVSAFGAIGLSATKVEAATGTTLSLTASTTTPAVGQSYTLSGSLTDSTGNALANKPIDIWVRHDGDNGILWKTMTTDSNGRYSTAATSIKNAYIGTVFKGDSVYASAYSNLVTVTPTGLSLYPTNYNPNIGQQYTLSGYLRDSAGTALGGKPIDIWYRHAGETTGHLWKTVYTGTDGKYSTPAVSTQTVYLRTVFKGDSVYASAYSNLVTVTPTRIPTTIEFLAVPLLVEAGQPTAVTVGIREGGGGTLCMSGLAVRMYVDGTYAGQVVTTRCDGYFVFTYPGLPVGTHTITASFAGNAQYAPSSARPSYLFAVAQLP